ncbi:Tetratricopeptide repeat family protein [Vibrio orientalis CIP 102891 = ATCC 33934]|uniref:MSHA biogenesis protein MshN n=1 Tax=Vibrio orientalis CIP 102891 = ATCC 33934 TaxID=675816 RepID=C9QN48_VIBOR|nr:tetratricopeptide repeat protein [Vibrio orientalis]EEX93375.1 MSHA biogenesis protein MshN [Vibrio orientalis CIP 102891 = ATCC 33934]EGU48602.1 Tetratricopeptide repeat family protein [Vibrio orientalis CIP 102891 = ATCC 33934]
MSAMNNALSELANKKSVCSEGISKAEVKPVKQRAILPWVVGSFGLSLAVGGWAVSQQEVVVHPQALSIPESGSSHSAMVSPTSKVNTEQQLIYHSAPVREELANTGSKAVGQKAETPRAVTKPQPILLAQVNSADKAKPAPLVKNGEVVIEQVELTPQQLSKKAQERAKKSLDSNNLAEALQNYHEALRYTPSNDEVRRRLSALYYGKGEVRKAAEILQKGIALEPSNAELRLSLAKMLMKEKQGEAALTVLSTLPESASVEYLSLRAVLAQKAKQDDLALQSYQKLVEREPESGRWWLGLGIQQERAFDLDLAKASYQQAITKLGLSSQTQQFIRDRLTLIGRLEEQPSEN